MLRPRSISVFALACFAVGGCGHPTDSVDGAVAPVDAAIAVPIDAGSHDLRPPADMTPVLGPSRLADTGLYGDFNSRTLAAGVIHYVPRYQLWSDGAEKERYLLLPPGTKIDTGDMDNWVFPVGTKVWKEFRVEGKLIETRLLQKVYDNPGGWWEVAYLWNEAGTDAVAVINGAPDAGGTSHDVPSQEDCAKCHSNVSDVIIGVSAIQLSSANGDGALSKLAAAGLLSSPPSPPTREFQPPGQGNIQDTLGYLHGNCGHCHNERSEYDHATVLKLRLHVGDTTPESTNIYKTSINVKMFHRMPPDITLAVVPGKPDDSQLWVRMGARDEWSMPTVCTKIADAAGLAVVRSWILALPH